MGKIIALTNQKGGVGKSTISFNMSTFLAEKYHKKVLVIDLDTQGNISHTLIRGSDEDGAIYDVLDLSGLQTKNLYESDLDINALPPMKATHGIDLVCTQTNDYSLADSVYQQTADGEVSGSEGMNAFVRNVQALAVNYDFVIIDCPPFLGDHVLSALLVCDYVITPVQPTAFGFDGVKGFFDNLVKIGRPEIFLGIVLNNVDKSWVRHVAMAQQLKESLEDKVFDCLLFHRGPYDSSVYMNRPLYSQIAWRTAATEFDDFLKEVIARINAIENSNITLEE